MKKSTIGPSPGKSPSDSHGFRPIRAAAGGEKRIWIWHL